MTITPSEPTWQGAEGDHATENEGLQSLMELAELLQAAGETAIDVQPGAGGVSSLLIDLDGRYSLCLNNAGPTWAAADVADLAEHDLVGHFDTGIAVETAEAVSMPMGPLQMTR